MVHGDKCPLLLRVLEGGGGGGGYSMLLIDTHVHIVHSVKSCVSLSGVLSALLTLQFTFIIYNS